MERRFYFPGTSEIIEWDEMNDAGARFVEKDRHPNAHGGNERAVANQLILQVAPHGLGAADADLFQRKQWFVRVLAGHAQD